MIDDLLHRLEARLDPPASSNDELQGQRNMDEEADGLKIVLTPVQMAAIMVGDNIPEQARLTDRLWGTAKTVGGVRELMGAAA